MSPSSIVVSSSADDRFSRSIASSVIVEMDVGDDVVVGLPQQLPLQMTSNVKTIIFKLYIALVSRILLDLLIRESVLYTIDLAHRENHKHRKQKSLLGYRDDCDSLNSILMNL